jgi:hypothetical protein
VTELIALGKIKLIKMMESEMGYSAAHSFTAHNLSIILFYL